MIRKFYGNNVMKGNISTQLSHFIKKGAIKFENGEKKNTCIIIVDESKFETETFFGSDNLNYLYKKFLTPNREVK